MKGLLDIAVPLASVQVADQEFQVRGLSPDDALRLYYRHSTELSFLFDQFSGKVKGGAAVEPSEVMEAGVQMVSGAPQIMAEIIALASGADPADEDTFAKVVGVAKALSTGIQMDALQKIGSLTFSSDMPPGKFMGLVLQMAQSATAALSAPT